MGQVKGVSARLFGAFGLEASLGRQLALTIRARKGRALIAYLAMKPDYRAGREELATLLWGDTPDAQARHSLRQCLSSLRQDLRPLSNFLIVTPDQIGLDGEGLRVDARVFLMLSEATGAGDLGRAAALYRGDFLADLGLDTEAFEAWRSLQAQHLRLSAARLFETLCRLSDQAGKGDRAVAEAERLVALEPTREDWHRIALTMWARYRGREAALERARTFAALMRSELGVGLEPETRALIEVIKRDAPASPSTAATQAEPVADREPETAAAASAPALEIVATSSLATRPSVEHPSVVSQPPRRRMWARRAAAMIAAAIVLALGGLEVFSRVAPWSDHGPAPHVASAGRDAARIPAKAAPSTDGPFSTVAVLRFTVDTAHSPEGQAFALSLTHNLIGYLVSYSQLRVVSDQPSHLDQEDPVDVAKVGADLGAAYAIVGHVQVQDANLRVVFHLVDTSNHVDLWSSRVQRDGQDAALVADEIARGIARALAIQVTYADAQRRGRVGDSSSEVGDLLIRGQAAEQLGPWHDNLSEAMRLYDLALRREPHNPAAMLGVARVAVVAYGNYVDLDPQVDLGIAERLLEEALSREPNSARAHYIYAQLQKLRGHYDISTRSFQRSLELNPSFIFANAHIGYNLIRMGKPEEGLQHIQEYLRMAPPNEPAMGYAYLFASESELQLGNTQAALDLIKRANAFFPGSPRILASFAAIYAVIGDKTKAASYAAAFRRAAPNSARRIQNGQPASDGPKQMSEMVKGLRVAMAETSD